MYSDYLRFLASTNNPPSQSISSSHTFYVDTKIVEKGIATQKSSFTDQGRRDYWMRSLTVREIRTSRVTEQTRRESRRYGVCMFFIADTERSRMQSLERPHRRIESSSSSDSGTLCANIATRASFSRALCPSVNSGDRTESMEREVWDSAFTNHLYTVVPHVNLLLLNGVSVQEWTSHGNTGNSRE